MGKERIEIKTTNLWCMLRVNDQIQFSPPLPVLPSSAHRSDTTAVWSAEPHKRPALAYTILTRAFIQLVCEDRTVYI